MKERCLNPNNKGYKNYGARGIEVCDRWLRFEFFISDMGDRPSTGLSLDRIDNNGNYEPKNCKWSTRLEQAANTRKLKWFYAYNQKTGEIYKSNNQSAFAREYGLNSRCINSCLNGRSKTHKKWRFYETQ